IEFFFALRPTVERRRRCIPVCGSAPLAASTSKKYMRVASDVRQLFDFVERQLGKLQGVGMTLFALMLYANGPDAIRNIVMVHPDDLFAALRSEEQHACEGAIHAHVGGCTPKRAYLLVIKEALPLPGLGVVAPHPRGKGRDVIVGARLMPA